MSAVWIDQAQWDEVQRLLKNITVYNGDIKYHSGGISIICGGEASTPGSQISWAKITAVTDAQNYTASIWTDRNETDPAETLKAVYVSDITDTLAINDWIPVQASNRTDIDYENIQQLGLL